MFEGPFTFDKKEGYSCYYPRDLRDVRMSELRKAAQLVSLYLSEDRASEEVVEEVLDLLYGELNRRLNKVVEV